MASAIDDLRYISRYGYRDPWAEATKSITDSLLSYADSKHRRDTLLADYKDKEEQRTYDRERDEKEDLLELYKSSDAESKLTLLQNENFSKHLPSGFAAAEKENNNKIVAYQNERDRRMNNIANADVIDESIFDDLRWLERVVPSSDTGAVAKTRILKSSAMSQYDKQHKSRYIQETAKKWRTNGILTISQYDDIIGEFGIGGNVDIAEQKLEDALSSHNANVEHIEDLYRLRSKVIIDRADRFSLKTVDADLAALEKSISRHFPHHINNMKHPGGGDFSFDDKLSWMRLGKPSGGDSTPFYEKYPGSYKKKMDNVFDFSKTPVKRTSNVIETDGTVTNNNVSEFHTDSDGRFALPEEEFAMPPESQVELQFKNGTTQLVNGENAWNQIQKGGVTYANSNKSGIYLKIGHGNNPVLERKAGSKIPGFAQGDVGPMFGDLGVVYQNPSKRQYHGMWKRPEGGSKLAFSDKLKSFPTWNTKNIKLQSGDLLIDTDTGTYHRVTIIEPPEGTPLHKMKTTSGDVLDRTVFRVGNKDYTAKQLTKKFMVPMTVPNTNQSQPEEVVERTEPKLISVTPFDADSAWVSDSTTWMEPAVEADTTYK